MDGTFCKYFLRGKNQFCKILTLKNFIQKCKIQDSNEVVRAAARARARASSSVLRPIDAHRPLDAEYSSTGESRSKAKLSPLRNTSQQSVASREDFETSSTQSGSSPDIQNFQPPLPGQSSLQIAPRIPPSTQLTNPMFQSAPLGARDHKRTCVVWDQEAGRFVSSTMYLCRSFTFVLTSFCIMRCVL